MKPAPFDYLAATSIAETTSMLVERHGNAKPVAGNQSLGPMLNLRLVRTGLLADISQVSELRATEDMPDFVRLGAAITHAEIEDGLVPDPTGGWMQQAAGNIAYRAVRNRGTIGGSLAHADPAADWVIILTGLFACALTGDPKAPKRTPMEDFVTGPFATSLASDELLLAVEIPKPGPQARWGYWKFTRQVGEFAKASATVLIDPENNRHRIAIGALDRQPLVIDDPIALIKGAVSVDEALSAAFPDRSKADLALHITALRRALDMAVGEEVSRT